MDPETTTDTTTTDQNKPTAEDKPKRKRRKCPIVVQSRHPRQGEPPTGAKMSNWVDGSHEFDTTDKAYKAAEARAENEPETTEYQIVSIKRGPFRFAKQVTTKVVAEDV